MIPKIIWSYWNEDKLPEMVSLCVDTWKKMNPSYTVIMLNENNYKEHCDIDVKTLRHYSDKEHQRTADYIRLAVLKKHGGVWIDSSTICIRPLNFGNTVDFYAYYIENPGSFYMYKFPAIENWFIACSKDNDFVNRWYQEFVVNTNNYESMDLYRISMNIELPLSLCGGYFAMHVAAQVVLRDLYKQKIKPKLTLRKAFESGPFELLNDTYSENICKANFDELKANFIKMRGTERRYMENNQLIKQCVVDKIKEVLNKPVPDTKNMELIGQNNLDIAYDPNYPHTNIIDKKLVALSFLALIFGILIVILIINQCYK
jgi:hypothetical protein